MLALSCIVYYVCLIYIDNYNTNSSLNGESCAAETFATHTSAILDFLSMLFKVTQSLSTCVHNFIIYVHTYIM